MYIAILWSKAQHQLLDSCHVLEMKLIGIFCNLVLSSKYSFCAFPLSTPFMSKSTFCHVVVFLGCENENWFCTERDPWCEKPKILACDVTHIGLSLRNLCLQGIETPSCGQEQVTPRHKRYDRMFLPYKSSVDPLDLRKSCSPSTCPEKLYRRLIPIAWILMICLSLLCYLIVLIASLNIGVRMLFFSASLTYDFSILQMLHSGT